MTALIDLVPGVSYGGPSDEAWEAAWEHIETTATEHFSEPSLAKAAGWTAARYVIRAGLALGLIERVSPPRAKPVFYRVADPASVQRLGDGTGPTSPTPTGPGPSGPTQPPVPGRAA